MAKGKRKNCGRKKIVSVWGEKVAVSFSVYPPERDKLRAYYQKLKSFRPDYCFPVPRDNVEIDVQSVNKKDEME